MRRKKNSVTSSNLTTKQDQTSLVSNKKLQKMINDLEIKRHEIEIKKQEELFAIESKAEIDNRASNLNRARSITVGTCFGGTTEVMMRSDGGRHVFCIMQPVEVIELIHQLAANVGCHIHLKPRDDFGSWRDWRVSEAEKEHLNGFPPFVNDMEPFQKLGASGFDQTKVELLMNFLAAQKVENATDDEKLIEIERKLDDVIARESTFSGAPNVMVSQDDADLNVSVNELKNKKVITDDGNILYMQGGDGGGNLSKEEIDLLFASGNDKLINKFTTQLESKIKESRQPRRKKTVNNPKDVESKENKNG